jgi:hypothetical protein
MKTISFALVSALSLGTALVPSLANAQSFGRGEWRNGHQRAPAVVVAQPPRAVPPVRVVTPRVTFRAHIRPPTVIVPAPAPVVVAAPAPVGYSVYGNGTLGNAREIRQEQQIRIGAMRGQLTPREYNRLMRGQADIDALQARAAADGVVSPFEARQIQQAQNVQARQIARLESNRRGTYRR